MMTPCPDGWREDSSGDVTVCEPYPETGPEACSEGDAHFPGEPGCRPIGDPCPPGAFATTLPSTGPVIYVEAAAPPGGDGSLASPFAALSDVSLTTLSAGTTVALAKGSYEGTLPLKAGVQVVGACVAQTVVTGVAAPVPAVITVTTAGAPAVVRNLTIADTPQRGVVVESGRALDLEGVLIDRAGDLGVLCRGSGAAVSLTDVVVQNTQPLAGAPVGGHGIDVVNGGHLTGSRLLVAGNHRFGFFISGEESEATVTAAVVRDTRPDADDASLGLGVEVQDGGHFGGSAVLFTGNRFVGVFAVGATTTMTLTDAAIRDTLPRASDGTGGWGGEVTDGARFDGSRVVISGNREIGIYGSRPGTSITLTDAVVTDTLPQVNDGTMGRGINVQRGAAMAGTRLVVDGNREVGILASSEGSTITLAASTVRDTQPQMADDNYGRGISVQGGARLDGAELLVTRNHDLGIYVTDDGSAVTLMHVVVADTLPRATNNERGVAIAVQGSARLDGAALRVEGAHQTGVLSLAGAVTDLTGVSISRVRQTACAETTCPEIPMGYAAAAVNATLRMTGFEVRDAATCGVFLGLSDFMPGPAAVDLASGIVADSAIGACVQVDGYDLDRLTNDVQYIDNGTNLDATMLPVPGAIDEVAP